ncbi:MAG TPA: cupin domain-containing protein, partial [Thermoleophilaceae bacterium]|jgi:quercetin dioxygenase-like cupin family protein
MSSLWFLNNLAEIHLSGDETGDRVGIVEGTGAPGNMPPLHVHHDDVEGFFVLEGQVTVYVAGEEPIVLGQGDWLTAPREVAHTYKVTSAEPARWLAVSAPARFDRLVTAVAQPAERDGLPPADTPIDADHVAEEAAKQGIEILGPPGALP